MLLETTISPNDAGQRAERFLRRYLPNLAPGRLQALFRRKEIKVARAAGKAAAREAGAGQAAQPSYKPIDAGYSLQAGDALRVFGLREDEAQRTAPHAKAAPATYPPPPILHEDADLLVVDKPSGMAAHPGTGIPEGASLIERVHALLAAREEGEAGGGEARPSKGWSDEVFSPALVHRLDKETSGVLLVAKSGRALRDLTEALRDGRIRKRYLALVAGHPQPASGTIDAALARDDNASGAKSRIADEGDGKRSVTHYRTLRKVGGYALLQVTLETGRMHQIRAHLAHIGHPIVGDTRYDKPANAREHLKALGIKRLFLHAEELSWSEGKTKRAFAAPLPEPLRKAVGE
jgi:RluA family pseudouridine synthase